jgi:hypothetical protein
MSKNKAVIETPIKGSLLENKTMLADAKKIAPTRRLYLIDPKNEATALMKAIANGQLRCRKSRNGTLQKTTISGYSAMYVNFDQLRHRRANIAMRATVARIKTNLKSIIHEYDGGRLDRKTWSISKTNSSIRT